jgi:diacylglycerol kinase (ATP)
MQALQLLEEPCRQPIDLARVQTPAADRLFANVASGGNSNRISASLTSEMKEKWGAWCYLRGAIEVMKDLNGYKLTVQCGNEPAETHSAWNFIVANGSSAGGVAVAPTADLADGLLDLIIIKDGTIMDMAQLAAGVVLQNYLEHENVVHRLVERVSITIEPDEQVVADGEPIEGQPLTFSVLPKALNVVVGPDFRDLGGTR